MNCAKIMLQLCKIMLCASSCDRTIRIIKYVLQKSMANTALTWLMCFSREASSEVGVC